MRCWRACLLEWCIITGKCISQSDMCKAFPNIRYVQQHAFIVSTIVVNGSLAQLRRQRINARFIGSSHGANIRRQYIVLYSVQNIHHVLLVAVQFGIQIQIYSVHGEMGIDVKDMRQIRLIL